VTLNTIRIILFTHYPELGEVLLNLIFNNSEELIFQNNNNIVKMSPTSGKGPSNNPLGSSNNPLSSGNGGPPNPNKYRNLLPYPESLDKNSKRPNNNPESLDKNYKSRNNNPDPLPDHESLSRESGRKRPYYRLDFTEGKGKCTQ
jgi:hypothetical protein